MAKCRYCGAEIVFVRTDRGKSMPCDPVARSYLEEPRGPVKILTAEGRVVSARLPGPGEEAHGVGHIPHWAMCPGADQARRRG